MRHNEDFFAIILAVGLGIAIYGGGYDSGVQNTERYFGTNCQFSNVRNQTASLVQASCDPAVYWLHYGPYIAIFLGVVLIILAAVALMPGRKR